MPGAGTLFWLLASNSYPDYDGYTVYTSKVAVQQPAPAWPQLSPELVDAVGVHIQRGFVLGALGTRLMMKPCCFVLLLKCVHLLPLQVGLAMTCPPASLAAAHLLQASPAICALLLLHRVSLEACTDTT